MANKNINILLKLTGDNFIQNMKKCTEVTKTQERKLQSCSNMISNWAGNATKKFAIVAKAAAAIGFGGLAMGIKTGLSEAFDLEGYRLQLETATKDTQKAAEIMKYAIDLANKTPFEGGELVEGAAKFEAMGMSAEKWLPKAGDMAAATNKGFDQAVEALIDAQTGELERLKEFGITKAMIVDEGEKKLSGVQIVNNQGQIVNQEKFNEAMQALMEEKFAGGMEKQATTVKGLWSTVTGVTKSALSTIVGMQSDGTIRSGSLLDTIKNKVQEFATKLEQWQNDGTIDRISAKATEGFQKISTALSWVISHGDKLLPVLGKLILAFAAFSILSSTAAKVNELHKSFVIMRSGYQAFKEIGGMTTVFKSISGGAKGLGSAIKMFVCSPFGVVLAIVAAVILIGIALYTHWDVIKAKAQALHDKIVTVFGAIKGAITGAFDGIKDIISPVIDWISARIDTIKNALDEIKNFASGLGIGQSQTNQYTGHNSTGTSYWRGGLTSINEGGRGEIVNLPNGTKIIPHDVAKKSVGGTTIHVQVTVQGNVIGNREFMEQTGNYIADKVLAAQGVV